MTSFHPLPWGLQLTLGRGLSPAWDSRRANIACPLVLRNHVALTTKRDDDGVRVGVRDLNLLHGSCVVTSLDGVTSYRELTGQPRVTVSSETAYYAPPFVLGLVNVDGERRLRSAVSTEGGSDDSEKETGRCKLYYYLEHQGERLVMTKVEKQDVLENGRPVRETEAESESEVEDEVDPEIYEFSRTIDATQAEPEMDSEEEESDKSEEESVIYVLKTGEELEVDDDYVDEEEDLDGEEDLDDDGVCECEDGPEETCSLPPAPLCGLFWQHQAEARLGEEEEEEAPAEPVEEKTDAAPAIKPFDFNGASCIRWVNHSFPARTGTATATTAETTTPALTIPPRPPCQMPRKRDADTAFDEPEQPAPAEPAAPASPAAPPAKRRLLALLVPRKRDVLAFLAGGVATFSALSSLGSKM